MSIFLGILLSLTGAFLMLIVLIQRGRGGGLAGAFGGLGGQSAFGAKAGDMFTRITIVVATFWILLCVLSVKLIGGRSSDPLRQPLGTPPPGGVLQPAPLEPGETGGESGATGGATSEGASGDTDGTDAGE